MMNSESKKSKYLVLLSATILVIITGIVLLVRALNMAHYLAMKNAQLLPTFHDISQCVILSCILIILSVTIIILMLQNNYSSNEGMKERVALLEKEKETMQEVAHHQRLEMIGTMTSSIAHEFNNMLTPIMGYSILSMEKVPEGNDELMDDLQEIYEASARAKKLILRMSSLSRKTSEAENAMFSPDQIVKKSMEIVEPAIPLKVETETHLNCPQVCLFVNETRIAQLLVNIVINAFQAMEVDGGKLIISTEREGDNVVFRLKDNGPGILPEILPKLFDPFFTTKEMGRGTGLGLAIARQIAENYNGSISVDSTLGKGTEFIVTLPVMKSE